MLIRQATVDDLKEWVRMRDLLWPGSLSEQLNEINSYFSGQSIDIIEVFVLQRSAANLGGFIEINIRNFAEGSRCAKVPYIEAWYIDKDLRSQGHGKALMSAAVSWAKQQGFNELASDTELDNIGSIAAHKALGFSETDRVVCFLKKLK